jgi:glycosyltransferase involved in cell wall biosynthesis
MSESLTTISVVIPVYNGERTIFEAVNSVLAQTFRDFELIVIDDGSQDTTTEILAAIHDSRLRVFSYTNAGVAASRNRGIELASGEFISFLDADDLWTPDKLELQLNALRNHPEAAVSYSWTDFIDETGKQVDYGIYPTVNGLLKIGICFCGLRRATILLPFRKHKFYIVLLKAHCPVMYFSRKHKC